MELFKLLLDQESRWNEWPAAMSLHLNGGCICVLIIFCFVCLLVISLFGMEIWPSYFLITLETKKINDWYIYVILCSYQNLFGFSSKYSNSYTCCSLFRVNFFNNNLNNIFRNWSRIWIWCVGYVYWHLVLSILSVIVVYTHNKCLHC